MRVLSVPGICCEKCVEKINTALDDAGVKEFEVDLEKKTVSVCDCDHCMEVALDCLKELGFEAERIA